MPEIELKLRGSPARLKAAFARLRKRAIKGSSFKKNLSAIYFDTAKDDLHAKGLSLRVREEDGAYVQTLKQDSAQDEALSRGEWSDPVSAAAPELVMTKSGRKLREAKLGEALKDVQLLPRFHTRVVREGFLLRPIRGALVEIVRDSGEIRAIPGGGQKDDRIRVSEIELELKQGTPEAIFVVALDILAGTHVQFEPRGKAARGYALISPGAAAVARKAEAPRIGGDETLAEVLRAAARRHFGQYLANMSGALRQGPASIHQMRVSMRRLRSALYAVRDLLPDNEYEAVRVKLKYLLQSLGAARDWEVLTEHIAALKSGAGAGRANIAQMRRAARIRKRRALMRAMAAIGSKENTSAVLEAMLWFERLPRARHGRKLKAPAGDVAAGLLSELFDRVRRRARNFEGQSVRERHRLRIACKNLRYNVELFGCLFARRKVDTFLSQLKPVQDDLGALNDVSRACDLLGELAKRSPRKAAANTIISRLEEWVGAADKRARKHVAKLRNAKPFW